MSYNLVRKGGIPAVAYSSSDRASQWSCLLFIKYCETRMQATISIRSSIPIHGYDDEQIFTLQYDADNVVPGTLSLAPSTIQLSQVQLNTIAREGKPRPQSLSLSVRNPCPIWCPFSSGSIAPKPGFDAPFHQLVKLARATDVHILFDYNWLHRDKQTQLQRLVSGSQRLVGFPVDGQYAKTNRRADWTVFSPCEDVVSEAPPSYAEASNKRSRQAAISSTDESPPPKRVLLSPAPLFAQSPTEKATTASTPSPKRPFPLAANTNHSQEAINLAVATVLPDILRNILPDMLPQLIGSPSPSPSPSRASNLGPKPLSSLRTLISARATAHAESQLQRIYTDTLDHATDLRNAADTEFQEILDEQKLDLTVVKDDVTVQLDRIIDDKLCQFRESAANIVEDVEDHAEKVYLDVRERLDELVGKERAHLNLARKKLEEDRRNFEEQRGRDIARSHARTRGRRAMSLP